MYNLVKSSDVVGEKVKNHQGENLGDIKCLVLDKHEGKVIYVVLSFGGFLGMGDKYFAMPWDTLSYNIEKNCYIINVDEKKLENSPGFDKDNWPNMADQTWQQSITDFYRDIPRIKKNNEGSHTRL